MNTPVSIFLFFPQEFYRIYENASNDRTHAPIMSRIVNLRHLPPLGTRIKIKYFLPDPLLKGANRDLYRTNFLFTVFGRTDRLSIIGRSDTADTEITFKLRLSGRDLPALYEQDRVFLRRREPTSILLLMQQLAREGYQLWPKDERFHSFAPI